MLKALALAGAVAVAALLSPAQPTHAAPLSQACQAGAFRQHDMAGVFVSPESRMRVEIFACGGSYLQWDNQYGTHYAIYYSDTRLPGGGVAATLMPNGLIGLDGVTRVGYKPAEAGWIQVITADPYGGIYGVYRLRKVTPAI